MRSSVNWSWNASSELTDYFAPSTHLRDSLCFVTGNTVVKFIPFSASNPFGRTTPDPKPPWMTDIVFAEVVQRAFIDSKLLRFDQLVDSSFRGTVVARRFTPIRGQIENILRMRTDADSDGGFLWRGVGRMIRECVSNPTSLPLTLTLPEIAWQSVVETLIYWLTFRMGNDTQHAALLEPFVRILPQFIPLCMMKDQPGTIVVLRP